MLIATEKPNNQSSWYTYNIRIAAHCVCMSSCEHTKKRRFSFDLVAPSRSTRAIFDAMPAIYRVPYLRYVSRTLFQPCFFHNTLYSFVLYYYISIALLIFERRKKNIFETRLNEQKQNHKKRLTYKLFISQHERIQRLSATDFGVILCAPLVAMAANTKTAPTQREYVWNKLWIIRQKKQQNHLANKQTQHAGAGAGFILVSLVFHYSDLIYIILLLLSIKNRQKHIPLDSIHWSQLFCC